jgi:hypothetical protein
MITMISVTKLQHFTGLSSKTLIIFSFLLTNKVIVAFALPDFGHQKKPNAGVKTRDDNIIFVKISYCFLTLEKFQSRVGTGERTGVKHGFLPPVLRKVPFGEVKGYLLACKRIPFGRRKDSF